MNITTPEIARLEFELAPLEASSEKWLKRAIRARKNGQREKFEDALGMHDSYERDCWKLNRKIHKAWLAETGRRAAAIIQRERLAARMM